MGEKFGNSDKITDLYRGWRGVGFHPNSPSGSGGPGFFTFPVSTFSVPKNINGLPVPTASSSNSVAQKEITKTFDDSVQFSVTEIPAVMKKKGWKMGAKVMEAWFAGKKKIMKKNEKTGITRANEYSKEHTNTDLFTMRWIRSFPIGESGRAALLKKLNSKGAIDVLRSRVVQQRDPIFTEKGVKLTNFIITLPAPPVLSVKPENTPKTGAGALQKGNVDLGSLVKEVPKYNDPKEIAKQLENVSIGDFLNKKNAAAILKIIDYKSITADFFTNNPLQIDPIDLHSYWQFQYEIVEKGGFSGSDSLDDMDAALHAFGLYAAVLKATINDNGKRVLITVNKIGVYMRDTFDFIDDERNSQYLGHWNRDGISYNIIFRSDVDEDKFKKKNWPIHNSDFRTYQDKNNKGGDLLLFSDVEAVDVNITFLL